MWRHLSPPREGWLDRVKSLGLVYPVTDMPDGSTRPYWNESAWYEVSIEEVEKLEAVTEELYVMCIAAATRMATSGEFTDESLALPPGTLDVIAESLDRGDPSVYARFDLVWNGEHPKMLEINGDTPTGLVETAVVQWDWLEHVMPDCDQWNSLHDRLVARWKELKDSGFFPNNKVHFVHSGQDDSGEEEMTTVYMRDTADAAGLRTYGHTVEGIGWDREAFNFVDFGDKNIDVCFKLYPWEDMLREEFGMFIRDHVETTPVKWIEPAWKLLLSTKAILPVLWEMYPNHPNLLPAYSDGPRDLMQWVAKPLQGREGANIRIHLWADQEDQVQEGGYGDQPMVYQQYEELPSYEGNYLVIGSWVVDGSAAGMLCRESDGPVTDYYSRVVPHAIPMALPPDEEQISAWLAS